MKAISKFIPLTLLVFFYAIEIAAQAHSEFKTDVLSYHLAIQLNDSSDSIKVEEHIQAVLKDDSKDISFDLYSVDDEGKGMRVHSMQLEGQQVDYLHENHKLVLSGVHKRVGDTLDIHLTYSGIPADGLIIGKNKFGDRTFFGDNWPNRAHHWFACNDHPSDKAIISYDVSAPRKYQVVANGTLQEKRELDSDTYLWSYNTDYELPTKVMVIGAAEFHVVDFPSTSQQSTPVSAWSYPQNEKEGTYDMELAVSILNWFENKISAYPFDKLANVQSTTRYGGMENASCIFYDEDAITGSRSMENLIVHEIAHQWFGNSASEKDWQHLWLSEGFATYLTNRYILEKKGEETYFKSLDQDAERIFSFHKQSPLPVVDTLTNDLNFLLNANAYQKGSWFLHMLNTKIGDSLFWKAIQTYYQTYQYSNATSHDFQQIVEDVCGDPMSSFFNQWLKQPGHPIVSMSVKKKKNSTLIQLEQLQTEIFSAELTLQVIKQNGHTELLKVPLTKGVSGLKQEKKIVLKLPYMVKKVILNPHRELLLEVR